MDTPFSFNRSIRIGSRRDRITGDCGALTGRELLGRSGVVRFLAGKLPDNRDARRIRHSRSRLARTLLLLAGQGRREHSDATALRDDPALRLATGDRAGTAPLDGGGRLPSQPTLSRRVAAWSAKEGVEVLREGLQRLAGRRPKTLVIDVDSLPVEVHGEQPGSAWNGYYHRRIYHPIVAAAGETGDMLDLRLREGRVHTAHGGLEFVLEVLERAERHVCDKATVRFDAGYPGEPLMAALEERGTHYVARVRNNAVLKRLALPAMDSVVWDALRSGASCGDEPRTWVCESSYRAKSWSRPRRVVQVVVERPGELIPRCFWLLTSMTPEEISGEALLALYRGRGKAEGHLGELMSVVSPALSSARRPKSHYRGRAVGKRANGVDAFACNQVRLLLAGFGYQIVHGPARRARAHDRHRLEPRAPCRAGTSHAGALHRLRPPRQHDHRRRLRPLADARAGARDAARPLRIDRRRRRTDPPPAREARTAPRCVRAPKTGSAGSANGVIGARIRPFRPRKPPLERVFPLREALQVPTLLS